MGCMAIRCGSVIFTRRLYEGYLFLELYEVYVQRERMW